jgi:hypothetical protein
MESETLGIDETTSDNAFGGTLGGRFISNRIFGGASVSFTTVDGSEPVWGLTVGYIFGGSRQPVQASRSKASGSKASAKSPAKAPAKATAKAPAKKTAPRKN